MNTNVELQGLTEEAEKEHGHILSPVIYTRVLLVLLVCTIITIIVSRINFGIANMIIAVLIASLKAGFVATFFMHLKFEGRTVLIYATYPVLILALLIGGTLADVAERVEVKPMVVNTAKP